VAIFCSSLKALMTLLHVEEAGQLESPVGDMHDEGGGVRRPPRSTLSKVSQERKTLLAVKRL